MYTHNVKLEILNAAMAQLVFSPVQACDILLSYFSTFYSHTSQHHHLILVPPYLEAITYPLLCAQVILYLQWDD